MSFAFTKTNALDLRKLRVGRLIRHNFNGGVWPVARPDDLRRRIWRCGFEGRNRKNYKSPSTICWASSADCAAQTPRIPRSNFLSDF